MIDGASVVDNTKRSVLSAGMLSAARITTSASAAIDPRSTSNARGVSDEFHPRRRPADRADRPRRDAARGHPRALGLRLPVSERRPLGRSVSIAHAQSMLRVSRRTVYYWITSGKLATVRTISGGSQRVLLESIWFQRRLKDPNLES